MDKTNQSRKNKSDKDVFPFNATSIILLVISGIILILAFFMPHWLTRNAKYDIDFSSTGQIGDTIGGIMSPFIAIVGIIITFLAFYIQYQANERQKKNFKDTITDNKNESRLNKFENQFYEMLRLHKENVNEISIIFKKNYQGDHIENKVSGRVVFKYFIDELRVIYDTLSKSNFYEPNDQSKEVKFKLAYEIFFHGLTAYKNHSYLAKKIINKNNSNTSLFSFLNDLKGLCENQTRSVVVELSSFYLPPTNINFTILDGKSTYISHYFRHLFSLVRFVVEDEKCNFDYSKKREYLKIVRSQLSINEQALLYYNWLSGLGSEWENSKNKFFSDYRMIHNLWPDDVFNDFDLRIVIPGRIESNYKKKPGAGDGEDMLFDYQEEHK